MKKAYNLTGKASNVATTSKVSENKSGEWTMGVRRPMANSKRIAATTATDTNAMIFLFLFLYLLVSLTVSHENSHAANSPNDRTHTRRAKRRCPRSGTESAIRRCVQ